MRSQNPRRFPWLWHALLLASAVPAFFAKHIGLSKETIVVLLSISAILALKTFTDTVRDRNNMTSRGRQP